MAGEAQRSQAELEILGPLLDRRWGELCPEYQAVLVGLHDNTLHIGNLLGVTNSTANNITEINSTIPNQARAMGRAMGAIVDPAPLMGERIEGGGTQAEIIRAQEIEARVKAALHEQAEAGRVLGLGTIGKVEGLAASAWAAAKSTLGFASEIAAVASVPATLAVDAHTVMGRNNSERLAAGEITQQQLRDGLLNKEGSYPKIRPYVENMLRQKYEVNAPQDPALRAAFDAETKALIANDIHSILQHNQADGQTANDLHITRDSAGNLGTSAMGNATAEVLKETALDLTINPAIAIYHTVSDIGHAARRYFSHMDDAGPNGTTPAAPAPVAASPDKTEGNSPG